MARAYVCCSDRELAFAQHLGHAEDAFIGVRDLVAHGREEARRSTIGRDGLPACFVELRFGATFSVMSRPRHCTSASDVSLPGTACSSRSNQRGPAAVSIACT
jgi:hypothetical protein